MTTDTKKMNTNDLHKVNGGERPAGFENAKYDIGYSYDSGLLWSGIPNHHIVITVLGYVRVEGGTIIYSLEHFEESYIGTSRKTIEKPESYIDNKDHYE